MDGKRMKDLRKKMDLTQTEFGWLLGIHPNRISQYERGHRLETKMLRHTLEMLEILFDKGLIRELRKALY